MPSPADRLSAAVPTALTAALFEELPAAGRRPRRRRLEDGAERWWAQANEAGHAGLERVSPQGDVSAAPDTPPKRRERRWPADAHPWLTAPADDAAVPRFETVHEPCHSLLRANDSADLPLSLYPLAINPYRGCAHGCQGCELARSEPAPPDAPATAGHAVLRLHAKTGAADRLREALRRPGYVPRPLNLGSSTDAYQPIERELRLTRALLEVLVEARHPVALATRSAGVARDADLLAELASRQQALVLIGLATLDPDLARAREPRASPPAARLQAMRGLAQAGVPVALNLVDAAVFEDLDMLAALLDAGAQAGACSVQVRAGRAGRAGAGALDAGLPPASVDPRGWALLCERTAALGLSLQLPVLSLDPFQPPAAPARATARGPRQAALF